MAVFRRIVPALLLLVALGFTARALLLLSQGGGAGTTRALAVAFLIGDVVINVCLITLLILGEPGTQALEEHRFPSRRRWLWYLFVGLAALSYVGLAPLFLFLYLHLRG